MSKLLKQFERYGKRSPIVNDVHSRNCVIYTRVSGKKQEDNTSLANQLKTTQEYSKKQGLNIMGYFGGKYESAASDERKEFNRMLSFIKRSKEKINFIIVFKYNRFSRTGPNAIYIKSQLYKRGIHLLSATEAGDPYTPTGIFQQDLQLLISSLDNAQRRELTMAGTRDTLLSGHWCGPLPTGYSRRWEDKVRTIYINEKGKILKKGFLWKAEGVPTAEIRRRLITLGLLLSEQRLSEIFRNPFYCGIIVHRTINGQVIDGKHEKMVSQEMFLKINTILQRNAQGYSHEKENVEVPLKRFLKCGTCGYSFAGYLVRRKGIHYYKCNRAGCKCNKNANQLHEQFLRLLDTYAVNFDYIEPVKVALERLFNKRNSDNTQNRKQGEEQLREMMQKIERLEERYVMEEIDREMYDKYVSKFKEEKKQIEEQLENFEQSLSNLTSYLDLTLSTANKLRDLWVSGSYQVKEKLQYLVFPEGIFYERENGNYRTPKVNDFFRLIATLTSDIVNEKRRELSSELNISPLVAHTVRISNSYNSDLRQIYSLKSLIFNKLQLRI